MTCPFLFSYFKSKRLWRGDYAEFHEFRYNEDNDRENEAENADKGRERVLES